MIALLKNHILDSENYWLLHQNYETDEIYRNLVDTLDDYRRNNESLIKLKKHIKEHRQKINVLEDSLEAEVFQLTLNTEHTFTKILGCVDKIKHTNKILDDFNLETFFNGNTLSEKFIEHFTQLYKGSFDENKEEFSLWNRRSVIRTPKKNTDKYLGKCFR